MRTVHAFDLETWRLAKDVEREFAGATSSREPPVETCCAMRYNTSTILGVE